MKLVLASNNKNKLREVREIMAGTGVEIISQSEAGCDFEADENGVTFEENAFIKAEAAMKATGMPCVADDSGLEVDALGGEPGVHTARYGGEGLTQEERNALILKNMENAEQRSARFVSSVVCVFPNSDKIAVMGTCEGTIALAPSGTGGFGYDPLFIPEGYNITMADMTDDEKNAISHRGRAFRGFEKELGKYLAK